MIIIAPSVLSADFGRLREEIEMLNESEAEILHVDVMDGRFVPNISFGFPVMEVLKKYSKKPLDVHLMIEEPEKYALRFADAGADWISFHLEATPHAHRLLQQIKEKGLKAGLAINPQTTVLSLGSLLTELDFVNIMTVNPGFGGQKFIASCFEKIKELDGMRKARALNFLIEVDGGVDVNNLKMLMDAGVNMAVAGNAVFKSENPAKMISRLYGICQ